MATLRSSSPTAETSPSEGRDWILIRGLIRSSFHWHQFPDELRKQFPHDRIHCIDIPGNGERFRENTPFSIAAISSDILKQIRNITSENTGNIHIIAISMGTMITTELLRQKEVVIQSAHLINGSAGNLSPPWKRMRTLSLLRLLTAVFSVEHLEKAILRVTSSLPGADQKRLYDAWICEAHKHPVSARNIIAQLISASSYRLKSDGFRKTNVFVYCGGEDRLVSPDCSRDMANFLNADIFRHEHAGHDLPLDEPYWLAEIIRKNTGKTDQGEFPAP